MPRARPSKKGSFGAHFDELMKHFTHHSESHADAGAHELPKRRRPVKTPGCVNRHLLDRLSS